MVGFVDGTLEWVVKDVFVPMLTFVESQLLFWTVDNYAEAGIISELHSFLKREDFAI